MRMNEACRDANEAISAQWMALLATFDGPEQPRSRVEQIASKHFGGQPCTIKQRIRGSRNYLLRFTVDGHQHVEFVLRFPIPGASMDIFSKVEAEVSAMLFIRQNTTIPVPYIAGWGVAEGEFAGLGPYIVMQYIEGTNLRQVIISNETDTFCRNDLDQMISFLYLQIAEIWIELFQHSFPSIGRLSATRNADGQSWSYDVVHGPLTLKMNELERIGGLRFDASNKPYSSSDQYFRHLAAQSSELLMKNPSSCATRDEFYQDYVTIHLFNELADHYAFRQLCNPWTSVIGDIERFPLFCDDMRMHNIIVDNQCRIVSIIDWEFTYAAPPGFLCAPPSWLVGRPPWAKPGSDVLSYVNRVESFIHCVKEMEERSSRNRCGNVLSQKMLAAWRDKSFYYTNALRGDLDIAKVLMPCRQIEPFRSVTLPKREDVAEMAKWKVKERKEFLKVHPLKRDGTTRMG